jgi:hypothetical protein
VAGVALDVVPFIGLWILLDSIELLNRVAEAYLGALALVNPCWNGLIPRGGFPEPFQRRNLG